MISQLLLDVAWFCVLGCLFLCLICTRYCRRDPLLFAAVTLFGLQWAFLLPYYRETGGDELLPTAVALASDATIPHSHLDRVDFDQFLRNNRDDEGNVMVKDVIRYALAKEGVHMPRGYMIFFSWVKCVLTIMLLLFIVPRTRLYKEHGVGAILDVVPENPSKLAPVVGGGT